MKKDLIEIALRCEKAITSNNSDNISKCIEEITLILKSEVQNFCYIYYFLGNLYSALSRINHEDYEFWKDNNTPTNAIKAVNYYRKALREEYIIVKLKPEIQTNLAIILKKFRRYIEVVQLSEYEDELEYDSTFIARYHKAYVLSFLAAFFTDEAHRILYTLEACKIFKWLRKNVKYFDHEEFRNSFAVDQNIKKIVKQGNLLLKEGYQYIGDTNHVPEYTTKIEKQYRNWCSKNILFLNPLNDISQQSITEDDILQFPTHIVLVGDGPHLSAAFSAIKRKYSFARYTLFEGIFEINCPHFEAKGLYLTNTLDEVCYDMATEKVKAALKIAFSVFDGLIGLLYTYFYRKKPDKKIKFEGAWIKKTFFQSDKITQNPFIEALYWIACDLTDVEQNNSQWNAPEPVAGKLRNIRNSLEHSWVRVADAEKFWDNKSGFDYATIISKSELHEYAIQVLQWARNSLTYFVLAVGYNEQTKDSTNQLSVSVKVPLWRG